MKKLNIVQPYSIGKKKMYVAMILLSYIEAHKIDPSTALLLLRSEGIDNLQLKIIREEDLVKNEIENKIPAEEVSGSSSRHHSPF